MVDDEPAAIEITASYLTARGLRWGAASSGTGAIHVLKEAIAAGDPFEICLVDLMMPGMNGTDFMEIISLDAQFSGLSVVLVTAFDEEGLGKEAIQRGFRAFEETAQAVSVLRWSG